jgi:hypothetical protein
MPHARLFAVAVLAALPFPTFGQDKPRSPVWDREVLPQPFDTRPYLYPYPYHRLVVKHAVQFAASTPPPINVAAQMCVHATVMRQTQGGASRLVVHLFNDVNTTGGHAMPADDVPLREEVLPIADIRIRFARKAGVLDIKFGAGCEAILEGYRECLKAGGRPFLLEEHHPHLRMVAMAADRDPVKFWEKMTKLLADTVLPITGLKVEYCSRLRAGVGSLGRPRYVALAQWMGGWICREAKAFVSPASIWATGVEGPIECKAADAVARAIRSPDPFYRPGKRWVVRRLGPRSLRIELDHLQASDAGRILHAMGAETANVHLATPGSATPVLTDLASRKAGWLADAAKALSEILEADWNEWQSSCESASFIGDSVTMGSVLRNACRRT